MKKRFIAGFVVLSMMMSLMTGCGGAAGAAGGQSADKYALEARTYPMRTELDRSGVKERDHTVFCQRGRYTVCGADGIYAFGGRDVQG